MLAMSLLLAACGGGDDRAEDSASREVVTSPGASVTRAAPGPTPVVSAAPMAGSTSESPSLSERVPKGSPVAPAQAHVFVPPAGTYVYRVEGFRERRSATGSEREELPERQTDEIAVDREEGSVVVEVTSSSGDGRQKTVFEVDEDAARLTELTTTSSDGVDMTVSPEPPVLVARLPYEVGDRWEVEWRDDAYGVQAVGEGRVVERETIEAAGEEVSTFVVELDQRIRSTVMSDLVTRVWIDPATGRQLKQEVVSQTESATGSSYSESRALLIEGPL